MNPRLSTSILLLLAYLLFSCGNKPADSLHSHHQALPEIVDFNLHIRPILSDRCYHCHGPDAATRKADLRLDTREGLYEAVDSLGKRHPIVAKKPGKSHLIKRIASADPEVMMPPPESKLELEVSDYELALLKKWVAQGAEWKPHWAFIPPAQSKLPAIKNTSLAKNEIDHFVLARLEREGLNPSAAADKETLLRRVTLDLTGLPPTLPEIDAFLADQSEDAFEKVVDRLLDSPHYGEQMTLDWLDLARYADTYGYQADYYRPVWRWRDWVIKAFNENMPYDQFVTWQLAGDLLPNATREQRLATGFNRNHAQNAEGGIVAEEYRVEYVADRTITLGTAFLGLTLQCARCHDHKYDPVSQKEFYQLFSFFNNVKEAGQITWHFDDMAAPTLLLTDEEVEQQLSFIEQKIEDQEDKIQQNRDAQATDFETWYNKKPAIAPPRDYIARFPLENARINNIPNVVNSRLNGNIIDPVTNQISEDQPIVVEGVKGNGLQLNGEDALSFPGVGRFSQAQAFSVGLWAKIPEQLERGVIFHGNKGGAIYAYKGYQVSVEKDRFDLRLAHSFPYNAIHLVSKTGVPREEWVHLLFTYDGSSRATGLRLYLNGLPLEMAIEQDNLYKDIVFWSKEPGGDPPIDTHLKVGGRWRSKGFKNGSVDEILVFDRQLSAPEVAALAGLRKATEATPAFTKPEWESHYLWHLSPAHQSLFRQLERLRLQKAEVTARIPEAMVMAESNQPRPAFVLERGSYDQPAERVYPGTPTSVLDFPGDLPNNRLGLAQWLFHPRHPLTTRVAVNRFWQHYFGQGIVESANDFGSQGKLPTHPELLDWLACFFRDSGWDVKALQKKIVLSATYQQDSYADTLLRAKDPLNQQLARGPSQRLKGENLRDLALAASGLLVRKVGGPPVRPYQPEGIWAINTMSGKYQQDHGDALYRRSLYTFWKRTIPPPSMNIFDAPNRSECIVSRQKTNTPLQALVALNDPQFVEAARLLAERMIKEGGAELDQQITLGFRLLTGRQPEATEMQLFEELYKKSKNHFQQEPEKADQLLLTGEYPADPQLDKIALASLALTAHTIMNFDGVLVKN